MKCLQSKDEVKLDAGLIVDVITIRKNSGAGGIKPVNVALAGYFKRSIIKVGYYDGMCCVRTILLAIAHLDKDTKVINVFGDNRRSTITTSAKDLYEKAGVPLEPCTYSHIKLCEEYRTNCCRCCRKRKRGTFFFAWK